MTKQILPKNHPIYQQPTQKVTKITDEIFDIIKQMTDVLNTEYLPGLNFIGLAANQIGYDKRIIMLNYSDGKQVLINPKIIFEEGEQITQEGCGSLDKNTFYEVKRPQKITVEYYDENGIGWEENFENIMTWVICHEVDHLDNIFIDDKAIKSFKRNV
jgi:peptide deformylase